MLACHLIFATRKNLMSAQDNTRSLLFKSGLLVLLIALADWRIDPAIPPSVSVSSANGSGRSGTRSMADLLAAALCTGLTEAFNSLKWNPAVGLPRDILTLAAFSSIGLFVYGVVRSRRVSSDNMRRIETEIAASGCGRTVEGSHREQSARSNFYDRRRRTLFCSRMKLHTNYSL